MCVLSRCVRDYSCAGTHCTCSVGGQIPSCHRGQMDISHPYVVSWEQQHPKHHPPCVPGPTALQMCLLAHGTACLLPHPLGQLLLLVPSIHLHTPPQDNPLQPQKRTSGGLDYKGKSACTRGEKDTICSICFPIAHRIRKTKGGPNPQGLVRTSWMAWASLGQVVVLSPAMLIRPSFGNAYTWCRLIMASHCSSDSPVKENIPICRVTCDQSPGVPSFFSSSTSRIRIFPIRSDIPFSSSTQRARRSGLPSTCATILAPCATGEWYNPAPISLNWLRTASASAAEAHVICTDPVRSAYKPKFLEYDCAMAQLIPLLTKCLSP
mmetsp:Transcript_110239/g.190971  ORF Transcript_110239/g.190971 Transcript_110239/m.190971 type:complete len:322 (-) Transcript_110239:703-1668(-)